MLVITEIPGESRSLRNITDQSSNIYWLLFRGRTSWQTIAPDVVNSLRPLLLPLSPSQPADYEL